MVGHRTFTIRTGRKIQRIDMTPQIKDAIKDLGMRAGWVLVSVPHTTAAVTIGENWDADVGTDLETALAAWVPDVDFRHSEGNSPAHFLSEVIGSSKTLIVENGQARFGRWQGIFLMELDGPRQREVHVDSLGLDVAPKL